MNIEHIAIWVEDIELMKSFYETYFKAQASERYHNPDKNFTSYFLGFDTGTRLELMHSPHIKPYKKELKAHLGLAHFAVSVGSKQKVHQLTKQLKIGGYPIIGEPRTTGDGYYESVILDPEGNRIEITV